MKHIFDNEKTGEDGRGGIVDGDSGLGGGIGIGDENGNGW